ncbi:MAG: methyltransferase [Pedosphaera sp.]|nr:methyltransferase [Pedosphaera sp.]
MNQIENLLKQTIGLHAPTIGSSLIGRAIRHRMQSHGLLRQGAYLRLLQQSPAELNALIEAVVIPETWFFREKEAFTALHRMAGEWLATHSTGVLRLLSVPCSSGEEPYSIAITLLEAGVPQDRFQIDALDISTRALATAQRAVYGKNSFRGKELQFRDDYFKFAKDGYVLDPTIKKQVQFHRGNLLDENILKESASYDFVFCRNLLIYFDDATQANALRKLHGLLAGSGTLFVGSAEVMLASKHGFISTGLPAGFACRKVDSDPERVLKRKLLREPPSPLAPASKLHPVRQLKLSSHANKENASRADLNKARQLADAGHLTEAATVCETYLREQGVSAEAYYLLGLVRDAAGADSQASELYRRALYLEPNHYETLVQLAALSEKKGDNAHAKLLYKRAERAKKHT